MAKKKPLIESSWKGITYVKSHHTGPYKLSEASQVSAKAFAIAAKMGKQFRAMFGAVLPNPTDKTMQVQLLAACKKWLLYRQANPNLPPEDITYLLHFQFNAFSSLQDRWRVPVQVVHSAGQGLLLQIPAFIPTATITRPANTTQVKFKIMAGCCNLANPVAIGQCHAEFVIRYDEIPVAAQQLLLPLPLPANSLSLVIIAMEYTTNKNGVTRISQDRRWLACGVVGGWVA